MRLNSNQTIKLAVLTLNRAIEQENLIKKEEMLELARKWICLAIYKTSKEFELESAEEIIDSFPDWSCSKDSSEKSS